MTVVFYLYQSLYYIAQSVLAQRWRSTEQMVHYTVVPELDRTHSDELYQFAIKDWSTHTERILRGLYAGNHTFFPLYTGVGQMTKEASSS